MYLSAVLFIFTSPIITKHKCLLNLFLIKKNVPRRILPKGFCDIGKEVSYITKTAPLLQIKQDAVLNDQFI